METESDDATIREMIDQLADICSNTIKKSDRSADLIPKRGPYLAQLELIDRLTKQNYVKEEELRVHHLETPMDCIKYYIELFHAQSSCWPDIRSYLHLLNDSKRDQLLDNLSELLKQYECKNASYNYAWTDLLREKLLFASHLNKDVMSSGVGFSTISRLFKKCSGKEQDESIVSAYAQLITHFMWRMDDDKTPPSWSTLFSLIVILEYILRRYPDCDKDAIVSLILCRLYALFGVVQRVQELCNPRHLDIKYIQRDSLGFIQLLLAERFGQFKTAIMEYTSVSTQYDQNEKDCAEIMVNAYKGGHFSQIPDLAKFSSRCHNSVFVFVSDVMNRLLSVCFAVESLDIVENTLLGDSDNIDYSKLCDNRDFHCISSLAIVPDELMIKLMQKESFDELNVFSEFKRHLHNCQTLYAEPTHIRSLNYFTHARLHDTIVRPNYFQLPLSLLEIAQKCAAVTLQGNGQYLKDNAMKNLVEIEEIEAVFKGCSLKEYLNEETAIHVTLERCAKLLQMLLLSRFLLTFMEDRFASILRPLTTQIVSKGDNDRPKNSLALCISKYHRKINVTLNDIHKMLKSLSVDATKQRDFIVISEIASLFEERPEEFDEVLLQIAELMEKSYRKSINEMLDAIDRSDAFQFSNLTVSG